MQQPNDLSRSLAAFNPETTLVAVVEMSQSSWLIAGIVPGLERHPLKKLTVDEGLLLRGFWLARWLRGHGVEAYVIDPTSVAVPRQNRRGKTDRLDTELLKRHSLAGYVASATTAAWPRSPQSRKKTANVLIVSRRA